MKMYLIYINNGGIEEYENDHSEIIGLYKNKENAIKMFNKIIREKIEETDFIIDYETDNKYYEENKELITRLFWDYQENWSCYIEIIVKELEVQ